MSKKTVFTTVTPLPTYMTKEIAMKTLRNHVEMIDLNPLVINREQLHTAPDCASAEETNAIWYCITDKITYLPGVKSDISYNACFHDLTDGLQTHTYAPAGVEIKGRWTVGGNEGDAPSEPAELGLDVPRRGLYLREDVELRCNFLMTGFVKKNLKNSHAGLVNKMLQKARDNEPRPPVPEKDFPRMSLDPNMGRQSQASDTFSHRYSSPNVLAHAQNSGVPVYGNAEPAQTSEPTLSAARYRRPSQQEEQARAGAMDQRPWPSQTGGPSGLDPRLERKPAAVELPS